MTRDGQGRQIQLLMVATVLLFVTAGMATAGVDLQFSNGLQARIHGPEDLIDDEKALTTAVGGPYVLQQDADNWYPFDQVQVEAALADMRGFSSNISVDVYILPAPPVEGGRSWSTQNAIFLVPGFGPVAPETVAYITTHEMGHVLTWARMDPHPDRWQRYRELRGIDGEKFIGDAEHAWLPREILAEDLRFLFGGGLATLTGTIENHDIVTPDRIEGMRELLAGYLENPDPAPGLARSCAYPNPCNPRTTIRMSLPEGITGDLGAELRIYDIRGSLVRRVTGGRSAPGSVEIQWDGLDNHGGAAASGRYLYIMKVPGSTARGAVTLVR